MLILRVYNIKIKECPFWGMRWCANATCTRSWCICTAKSADLQMLLNLIHVHKMLHICTHSQQDWWKPPHTTKLIKYYIHHFSFAEIYNTLPVDLQLDGLIFEKKRKLNLIIAQLAIHCILINKHSWEDVLLIGCYKYLGLIKILINITEVIYAIQIHVHISNAQRGQLTSFQI